MTRATPPSERELEALERAIKGLQGLDSAWRESVWVVETFDGQAVWEGAVHVFAVTGHNSAKICYAWASPGESGKVRYYAVLHSPPVDSPRAAVRASIMRDYHAGK